jgi:hypothetical protein
MMRVCTAIGASRPCFETIHIAAIQTPRSMSPTWQRQVVIW